MRFHSVQPMYTMLSSVLNKKQGTLQKEKMDNQIRLTEERSILSWAAHNMEDGQDPLKRETAPYFWADICDYTQRKHSNPQILPENTSEKLAIPGKRERWVL